MALGANRSLPCGNGCRLAFSSSTDRRAMDRRLAPTGRRGAGIDRSGEQSQYTLPPRLPRDTWRGGRPGATVALEKLVARKPPGKEESSTVADDCSVVGLAAPFPGQRIAPAGVVAGRGGHRHDSPDLAEGSRRPRIAGRSGAEPSGTIVATPAGDCCRPVVGPPGCHARGRLEG